jgi:uncharacterized protein (DUF58 family)
MTEQSPKFDAARANAARVSPETVMRIKDLELRAKIVVEGFMSGLHRSPYHGFSVEFTDYRQYTPGDDLRYLDWKLLARQDRYYIKRFEDETNLRCYLLVDLSRSMGFGSQSYTKADYAKTMAATFAYFLSQQRDAVGLLTFADQIQEIIPPRFRAGHLRRLMLGLEHATVGTSTDLATPLEQIAQTVNKRGMIVLLSDLLAPTEQLEQNLGYLRSQGHDVVILRTLDPQEVNFEFRQASLFQDMESGKQIYVDPQTVSKEYKERFQKHHQEVRKICEYLGVDFFSITTDQALEVAMFDLIQSRAHRGREFKRRNQTAVRGDA